MTIFNSVIFGEGSGPTPVETEAIGHTITAVTSGIDIQEEQPVILAKNTTLGACSTAYPNFDDFAPQYDYYGINGMYFKSLNRIYTYAYYNGSYNPSYQYNEDTETFYNPISSGNNFSVNTSFYSNSCHFCESAEQAFYWESDTKGYLQYYNKVTKTFQTFTYTAPSGMYTGNRFYKFSYDGKYLFSAAPYTSTYGKNFFVDKIIEDETTGYKTMERVYSAYFTSNFDNNVWFVSDDSYEVYFTGYNCVYKFTETSSGLSLTTYSVTLPNTTYFNSKCCVYLSSRYMMYLYGSRLTICSKNVSGTTITLTEGNYFNTPFSSTEALYLKKCTKSTKLYYLNNKSYSDGYSECYNSESLHFFKFDGLSQDTLANVTGKYVAQYGQCRGFDDIAWDRSKYKRYSAKDDTYDDTTKYFTPWSLKSIHFITKNGDILTTNTYGYQYRLFASSSTIYTDSEAASWENTSYPYRCDYFINNGEGYAYMPSGTIYCCNGLSSSYGSISYDYATVNITDNGYMGRQTSQISSYVAPGVFYHRFNKDGTQTSYTVENTSGTAFPYSSYPNDEYFFFFESAETEGKVYIQWRNSSSYLTLFSGTVDTTNKKVTFDTVVTTTMPIPGRTFGQNRYYHYRFRSTKDRKYIWDTNYNCFNKFNESTYTWSFIGIPSIVSSQSYQSYTWADNAIFPIQFFYDKHININFRNVSVLFKYDEGIETDPEIVRVVDTHLNNMYGSSPTYPTRMGYYYNANRTMAWVNYYNCSETESIDYRAGVIQVYKLDPAIADYTYTVYPRNTNYFNSTILTGYLTGESSTDEHGFLTVKVKTVLPYESNSKVIVMSGDDSTDNPGHIASGTIKIKNSTNKYIYAESVKKILTDLFSGQTKGLVNDAYFATNAAGKATITATSTDTTPVGFNDYQKSETTFYLNENKNIILGSIPGIIEFTTVAGTSSSDEGTVTSNIAWEYHDSHSYNYHAKTSKSVTQLFKGTRACKNDLYMTNTGDDQSSMSLVPTGTLPTVAEPSLVSYRKAPNTVYLDPSQQYILGEEPQEDASLGFDSTCASFSQPILSSNGTMGGSSFAVSAYSQYSTDYAAWKAFDSDSNSTSWVTSSSTSSNYIQFYNPDPIVVTKLTVRNNHNWSYYITAGTVRGSNNGSTWTLLKSYTNSTSGTNSTWTINMSDNKAAYKYYRIYASSQTGSYSGFRNIAITAYYPYDSDNFKNANQKWMYKDSTSWTYNYLSNIHVPFSDLFGSRNYSWKNNIFFVNRLNKPFSTFRAVDADKTFELEGDENNYSTTYKTLYLTPTKKNFLGFEPNTSLTYSNYNFDIVGSPSISSSYILSNCTTSSYILVDKSNFSYNNYSYYFKATTGSSDNNYKFICEFPGLFGLAIYSTYLYIYDWYYKGWYSYGTYNTNTTYYFKVTISGSTMYWYSSTDGSSWTQVRSNTRPSDGFSNGGRIGYGYSSYPFNGTIDLNSCYITDSAGNVVWKAIDSEKTFKINSGFIASTSNENKITTYNYPSNVKKTIEELKKGQDTGLKNTVYYTNITDSDESDIVCTSTTPKYITEEEWEEHFTKVGNPTITNKVASNFSSSNYLKLDTFTVPTTAYEFIVNFTTGSDITTVQNLISTSDDDDRNIYISESYIWYWDGSTGTKSTFAVNSLTNYWVKVLFDGTNTIIYALSDDDYTLETLPETSSWTQCTLISGNVYNGYTYTLGNCGLSTSTTYPYLGSINLANCIARNDTETLWVPYTKKETTEYEEQFTKVGSPTISSMIASDFSLNDYIVPNVSLDPTNNAWVQPILLADGTLGGSSFAVQSSASCCGDSKAFHVTRDFYSNPLGAEADQWQINGVSTSSYYYMTMYNPTALYVSSIDVRNTAQNTYVPSAYNVYGSNDNSSWTLLTEGAWYTPEADAIWNMKVNATVAYKYIRIGVKPSTSTSVMVERFKLNATEAASNATPWEVVLKTKFTANDSHYFGNYLKDYSFIKLYLASGKLGMLLSFNGSSWDVNQAGTTAIDLNTWYWIKTYFTGSAYCIDLSTDGNTFTNYLTVTNSNKLPGPTYAAIGTSNDQYLHGSMDLSQCYIKVNGEKIWTAYTEKVEYEEDFTRTGEIVINSDKIASNFSDDNYIEIPTECAKIGYTYYYKFSFGDVSRVQFVINKELFDSLWINTSKQLVTWSWSQSKDVTILSSISNFTTYWVKVVVTASTRTYYISYDGINYGSGVVVTDTSTQNDTTKGFYIGNKPSLSNQYFGRCIDLSAYKITDSSGVTVWTPYKKKESITYKNNFIASDNLTISNKIVSGFSQSTYLYYDTLVPTTAASTWEVKLKVNSGSNITDNQIYYCVKQTDTCCPIAINIVGSKFAIYLSSNGTSWDIAQETSGTYTVLTNTVYYLKVLFDGSKYVLSYSLDDITYTDDITVTSSTKIKPYRLNFGGWYKESSADGSYAKGRIDLSGCYVKINDEIWWEPYVIDTGSKENFTYVGAPLVLNNVASGFTSSDYIIANSSGIYSNSTFEMVSKFKFNSSLTGWNHIIDLSTSGNVRYGQVIDVYKQETNFVISTNHGNGSSWLATNKFGTTSLSADTYYWVKYTFDGSAYKTYLSTDGSTWNLEITDTETTAPALNTAYIGISHSINESFNGSIDLANTYIKVNDDYWWKPYITSTSTGNFNVVGTSVIISNKIASGFTSTSYIELTNAYRFGERIKDASSWEVSFKYYHSSSGVRQKLFASGNTDNSWIGIESSNVVRARIKNNTSFIWDYTGTTTLPIDNWYWFKLGFNGSKYYIYTSTDGETWTLEAEQTSSLTINEGAWWSFGASTLASYQNPVAGKFDLNYGYININGKEWWEPYTDVEPSVKDIANYSASSYCFYYDEDGNELGTEPNSGLVPTIYRGSCNLNVYTYAATPPTIVDGVTKILWSSTYVRSYSSLTMTPTTSFEMRIRFKTPETAFKTTGVSRLMALGNCYAIDVMYDSTNTVYKLLGYYYTNSTTTTIQGTTTLEVGTEYDAKLAWDGTNVNLYLKKATDTEYTVENTAACSAMTSYGTSCQFGYNSQGYELTLTNGNAYMAYDSTTLFNGYTLSSTGGFRVTAGYRYINEEDGYYKLSALTLYLISNLLPNVSDRGDIVYVYMTKTSSGTSMWLTKTKGETPTGVDAYYPLGSMLLYPYGSKLYAQTFYSINNYGSNAMNFEPAYVFNAASTVAEGYPTRVAFKINEVTNETQLYYYDTTTGRYKKYNDTWTLNATTGRVLINSIYYNMQSVSYGLYDET